jgi:DNA-directed RNA polymerase alpha subunit
MQIQRVKTVNELDPTSLSAGMQPDQTLGLSGGPVGANVVTKDYFEANPVFYYCYRIFPFERGHGIFVANSIRRFLLYEIPTIAITSVLIHSKISEKPAQEISPWGEGRLGPLKNDPTSLPKTDDKLTSGAKLGSGLQNTAKTGVVKPSTAQLKKKKVTKKALKEQAAELFSYSLDHFPVPLTENLETEEVSSLTEFTTIPFVRESFLEILLNLKACVFENLFAFTEEPNAEFSENWPKSETDSQVLKGKLILNASQESVDDPTEISKELFFQKDFSHGQEPTKGANTPGRRVREYKIWAKDLILPPGLKVKNPNLVLATLVAPKTNCELELNFEKIFQSDLTTLSMKTGRVPHRAEEKRRNVPIDGTLFPIKKVNFALSYTKFQKEIITFEIWTNGSVNPRQAIFQSVEKILTLFQNLREDQVTEIDAFAETALDEFEQATEAESQTVEPEENS